MEQTREPMDKNRIGGVPHRTSGQVIAKSESIKGAGRKFGGCARKAVELTSGDLRRVLCIGTEGTARFPDRVAEVSRGQSRHGNVMPKARTVPARG